MVIHRPFNFIVAILCTVATFIPPIDIWSLLCVIAASLNYWLAFSE